MSATILENLSNRKLLAILTLVMVAQVLAFYVGAFLTPSPSSIEQFTSIQCFRSNRSLMAIPRFRKSRDVEERFNCDQDQPKRAFQPTTFAVQLPLPRDGMDLAYSRWMQTLLVVLDPEFQYEPLIQNDGSPSHEFTILLDIDLAVKNSHDNDWKILAQRKALRRTVKCSMKMQRQPDCNSIQLFELQSLHYDHYLINFEINEDKESNKTIHFPGRLQEIAGVAIHHNGGFTQIWLTLKSVCFIATLSTLIWYRKRLNRLNRKKILIESILVGLGFALTVFNAPVEFLTLIFEINFMTFLNDLRQGMFYCVLFSFWIIFFGEHLQDGTRKGVSLAAYIKELLAICVASLSLLVFDLSERGLQAMDPFVTIWESRPNLATLSIGIASAAAIAYIVLLTYYVFLAYRTISGSKLSLTKLQITKRLKYQGIIYRFKFLLSATMVCAVSTFIFYILSQRNEWNYDEDRMTFGSDIYVEWTSAMLLTVCAMWNLYVIVLMILYAPSYKGVVAGDYMADQIEFDCLTEDKDEIECDGDMKLLQQLASKSSLD